MFSGLGANARIPAHQGATSSFSSRRFPLGASARVNFNNNNSNNQQDNSNLAGQPQSAASAAARSSTQLSHPPASGYRTMYSRALETFKQMVPGAAAFTETASEYALPIALVATTGAVGLLAWLDVRMKTRKPLIQMASTPFNESVMSRCPALTSTYRPFPLLTNGHVETIFAARYRRTPDVTYHRECILTVDGGCISLDWELFEGTTQDLPFDAPVLILLPGLTGGSDDNYVRYAVQRAHKHGIRAVVFNSRGTADSPVTTPQYYSASFTGDLRAVIAAVSRKFPESTLLAAGWSLGGNILVNYLGEEGTATPLAAAVSLCNPFDMVICNAGFKKGFNRIYDWNLANGLKRIMHKHDLLWNGVKGSFKVEQARKAKTLTEFDDAITVPSFGWESVEAYYAGSGSCHQVPNVKIPLLCIQALDDPIAPKEAIPFKELAANPNCTLVCTTTGGHLGWVSGSGAPTGCPWSDEAMMQWLDAVVKELPQAHRGTKAASKVATHGGAVAVNVSAFSLVGEQLQQQQQQQQQQQSIPTAAVAAAAEQDAASLPGLHPATSTVSTTSTCPDVSSWLSSLLVGTKHPPEGPAQDSPNQPTQPTEPMQPMPALAAASAAERSSTSSSCGLLAGLFGGKSTVAGSVSTALTPAATAAAGSAASAFASAPSADVAAAFAATCAQPTTSSSNGLPPNVMMSPGGLLTRVSSISSIASLPVSEFGGSVAASEAPSMFSTTFSTKGRKRSPKRVQAQLEVDDVRFGF